MIVDLLYFLWMLILNYTDSSECLSVIFWTNIIELNLYINHVAMNEYKRAVSCNRIHDIDL